MCVSVGRVCQRATFGTAFYDYITVHGAAHEIGNESESAFGAQSD